VTNIIFIPVAHLIVPEDSLPSRHWKIGPDARKMRSGVSWKERVRGSHMKLGIVVEGEAREGVESWTQITNVDRRNKVIKRP
jgi:hypothetical protein